MLLRSPRPTGLLCLLSLLLTLTGCQAVYAPAPVGDTPVRLEPTDWDGTWMTPDFAVQMVVTDAENGRMTLAWLEESDGAFKQKTIALQIRSWLATDEDAAEWEFASFPDENDPSRYLWGKVRRGDKQITFWGPHIERFRQAVKSGKLPGQVIEKNVILGELTAEHMKLITSQNEGLYFNWEEPLVLFRHGQ